jgi:cytochrome c553/mono/diheme cytochrome c family protein
VILPLLFSLLVDEPAAEPAQVTQQQLQYFEKEVRPLLDAHCLKCHGPTKQWAGLRLDSREALLSGGDSGPAIVPGNPDASLLVKAIRHEDENLQMPQDEKLSDQQIATLTQWVKIGAPFPEAAPAATRSRDPNHWAFRPSSVESVPHVQNEAWPTTDVDRFILARLESANLKPSAKADKRTLIRRVTFDLTGLPPTPAEINAFLADESDNAYVKLVDRLLASPAYGERWGRHWLDVARYADSNGLDENVAHGNAWRYRDYVVQAFNADKPFDRFVVEQIAGDLLPAMNEDERNECLIATGFLSIGPKVLAEVNMPKMRMDIVDEQIDTVGRVFMGMTFGCARCHDHKFDPIQTADYYGLAGIFKSTRTMDTYTKVAKWHEYPLKTDEAAKMQSDYDARLAAAKQAVESLVAKANESARGSLPADQPVPDSLESLYPEATRTELTKLRAELAAIEKAPPELPAAMGVREDDVADVAIHVRGNPSRLGDVVPRHLPPVMIGAEFPTFTSEQSGRLELAQWLVNPHHPLTARVLVNRFWRWHFGEGLVRSTDNFGLLGDLPTHPELLNWLSAKFINDGWSLKSFHRLILTSSVYQQCSVQSPEALKADPDNLLWSRISVRRLSAEEVRDSLLAVSGQLDPTMGGSLLKVKNRGYLFDHTSIDTTDYNSPRRSLYLPVIRNNVFDMFQLLDFPDPAVPTGDRATTTVAPQALMMMNSEFVMQAADKLAERIQSESADEDRLTLLYQLTLGRPPQDHEQADDLEFLRVTAESLVPSETDAAARQQKAWSVLAQVLLASSEFLYVQ